MISFRKFTAIVLVASAVLLLRLQASAEEPAKADPSAPAGAPAKLPDAADSPGPNRADEPLASRFSLASAGQFLDTAAVDWTTNRKCFTCHTNFAYLIARPAIGGDSSAQRQVRSALEEMVDGRWEHEGPRWDAEVVMTGAVLALNDSATTGKLHAATRNALGRMWKLQRADGGWTWLKCHWPPMENDDDFAIPVAAIALGAAPENYAQSPEAVQGLEKLRGYLQKNPPPTLHHRAMLLWAQSYVPALLTADERADTIRDLRAVQQPDGGWPLAGLGDWPRADKSPQDTKTSDGYGTGFVIYVLRRGGVPADDPALVKGIAWLTSHQRASGRWFTRSLYKDNKHYISHAGTAFAVMALTACEPSPAK